MIMTMRSFRLIVAGFVLGVGVPIHIGMMGEMYLVAWALIACWAALLIHKYAAEERALRVWVEAKLCSIRKDAKEKDDA